MKWVPIIVSSDSVLFPIFCEQMKKADSGQESRTFTLINKKRSQQVRQEVRETYRIDFTWQSDDICGLDFFKGVEDDGKST